VDVYITKPDAVLANISPTYSLGYGGNTTFQRMAAGSYRVRATTYNNKSLLYDSGPINLPVDAAQNIYLYGITATHAFTATQVGVTSNTVEELPSLVSAVRVVNAAYQTGAIDMQVDGAPQFSNLAYRAAVASYQSVAAGERAFAFEAHAAPGTAIATLTATPAPSTDTTLLVSGPSDALVVTPMPDFNRPPTAGTARLRVVNASPDIAAFDVAVDDKVVATNVSYPGPSEYFNIASGNHTVKLFSPGTTTPVFTFPSATFNGANVYSLYLMGPSSGLVQLVVQDNSG
jgi:hypothetical protein